MAAFDRPNPQAQTIRIVVEYDGTAYAGWQRQNNGVTVQERIETAIRAVTRERVVVHGSGRTDAGVHAAGQVAHFRTTSQLLPMVLRRAINANLPDDIVVLEAERVRSSFHARFDATWKVYEYRIRNSAVRGALDRHVAWFVLQALDVGAMRRAAKHLVGRRDLRSFVAEGGNKANTVRTIKSLDIRRKHPYILVTIQADGFLYKVVRSIVGTLVWVGSGRISPLEFQSILDSRDRGRAGPTAPPKGLTLLSVEYTGDPRVVRSRSRVGAARTPRAPAKPRG